MSRDIHIIKTCSTIVYLKHLKQFKTLCSVSTTALSPHKFAAEKSLFHLSFKLHFFSYQGH